MKTYAFLMGILASACAATVGTNSATYVPRDAAQTCASYCSTVGLALNSVVIMASNVGCVCSAAFAPPGAGGAGGMAALMMEQQRQSSSNARAGIPTTTR